jgi:hypothetical protein
MLSKELEILRLIEELYHGDTTEQEMMDFAEKNQTKIQAWKDAFDEYPLFEVTKAINHFYTRKSSKTRPNIAQITAILQDSNASKETVYEHNEIPRQTFGMEFAALDAKERNMNWLVPEYLEVERLILADYYPFIQNIYKPTYDEFRECMKRHSMSVRGKEYQFLSSNEVKSLPFAEQEAYRQKNSMVDLSSIVKRIN